VPTIVVDDVSEETFILDVREEDEWAAGHVPAARHVPMMTIPQRLAELPQDRDVVVVCRVGSRSAQVVAFLQAQGRDRVWNLDGGMYAWQAAGRPMVSEDGRDPRVL
jgi:rhodanese-related sulfurtransferase